MGVRSGVCIALVLLLLMMLVLRYSACVTSTSGPFAVFHRPRLAGFYRVGPLAFASVLVAPDSTVLE